MYDDDKGRIWLGRMAGSIFCQQPKECAYGTYFLSVKGCGNDIAHQTPAKHCLEYDKLERDKLEYNKLEWSGRNEQVTIAIKQI